MGKTGFYATLAVVTALIVATAEALAETPTDFLQTYAAEAQTADNRFTSFSAERGKEFFTTTHGGEWSCSSCHTKTPLQPGRHAKTGKTIDPMAPAVNSERFTNASKVQKWFRRNCNDVLNRACPPPGKRRCADLSALPQALTGVIIMPKRSLKTLNKSVTLSIVTTLLLWPTVWADTERFTATHPAWKTECGGCHVPYPPALLPAASWRAIMTDLNQHFGTDASLDPQAATEVTTFLVQHAGRDRGPARAQPTLRITETAWFKHEHEEELPATIWRHPAVKSPANCSACHTKAADGDYSEATLRVPH